MEFGSAESLYIYPCLSCTDPIYEKDVLRRPLTFDQPDSLTFFWMKRLRRLYRKVSPLKLLVEASFPVFIGMAFVFGSMDSLRPYAAIPLTLFVVSRVLLERVPLTTMPTGIRTAVTDQGNKYRGAGKAAFLALVSTVVVSLLIELVNQYVNEPSLCYSDLLNRSRRCTKRIASSLIFSIPLVYCVYMVVSNDFTSARSPIPPSPENDALIEQQLRRLPKNNPDTEKMKKVWRKRDQLEFSFDSNE